MKVVAASYPGIKEYLLQIYFTCDFPFLQILILICAVHPLKKGFKSLNSSTSFYPYFEVNEFAFGFSLFFFVPSI